MIYPIKPTHTPGKDFCAYWENFLSEDDINIILDEKNWNNMESSRMGVPGVSTLDVHTRRSSVSWLYHNEDTENLWKKFSDVITEVNSRFFHFDLTGCYEPMQLSVYNEGTKDFYDWHTDDVANKSSGPRVPRKLSVALLLSDPSVFDGGQLQIKANSDNPINLELKRGRAWFFPSYTLHTVTPVTRGIRKSLVLWVGGPEFR